MEMKTAVIKLRSLTLLYGNNNAGKSVLLRASVNAHKGAKQLTSIRNSCKDQTVNILATNPQILLKVSHWCEKNFQQKIVIEEVAKRPQIKLQSLINSAYKIELVNASEGLIQVLPVLTAAAMASGVLGIENPESFLHTKLHAALAEYFFEIVKQDNPPKILLETHSENFFLRTQLEIARGDIDPELVMVYWVRQLDDGQSIAKPIVFDSKGRPQGEWPRDIFHLDTKLAVLLIQERQKQSNHSHKLGRF